MIVTESNNGPCPHNVTNILCHVFASSSFKSKAFFVIVCIVSFARCVSHFMLQVTWVTMFHRYPAPIFQLTSTFLTSRQKRLFLLFRYSQIIEISHRDIINQYTQLVYITYSHQRYIHTYANLRYFMLRMNAMMIWIRINPFNIHIMYKKDKHLLTLQCFLFWQQVSLPYVTVLLSFFSSLYYVDEIGYY